MKIFLFIMLFSFITLESSQAGRFKEGIHYSVITTSSARTEAGFVEYFSFSCPACFAIEPMLLEATQALSPLKLTKVHVKFGGQKSQLSQAAFTLIVLLDAHGLSEKIFSRIHRGVGGFSTEEELIEFFVSQGHDEHRVRSHLSSFSFDIKMKTMNADAKARQIERIPTLIVNQKYKINNDSLRSAKQLADMVRHLNELP